MIAEPIWLLHKEYVAKSIWKFLSQITRNHLFLLGTSATVLLTPCYHGGQILIQLRNQNSFRVVISTLFYRRATGPPDFSAQNLFITGFSGTMIPNRTVVYMEQWAKFPNGFNNGDICRKLLPARNHEVFKKNCWEVLSTLTNQYTQIDGVHPKITYFKHISGCKCFKIPITDTQIVFVT